MTPRKNLVSQNVSRVVLGFVIYVNSNITIKPTDELNNQLKEHIKLIKETASRGWSGEKGYFFDSIIKLMNQFIFNCYFRAGAGSTIASVANFHSRQVTVTCRRIVLH